MVVLGLIFVLLCSNKCPSYVCIHLLREEGASYLSFIVFLVSCGCGFCVALPRGTLGLSVVRDFVIPVLTTWMSNIIRG